MKFSEKFMIANRSLFYERLQKYHNIIFESGIRQHWKARLKEKEKAKLDRVERFKMNEEYLLKMQDIHGIFYMIVVGYVLSLFAFIFEIFYFDFLKKLKIQSFFCELLRKKFYRGIKIRKIKVRPIEVD